MHHHRGVSKRDWLAALALQGLITAEARYATPASGTLSDPQTLAHSAVNFADALLEELAR